MAFSFRRPLAVRGIKKELPKTMNKLEIIAKRLPVLGSAITVTLGFLRSNVVISFISIAIGKFLRYWLLVYGAERLFC